MGKILFWIGVVFLVLFGLRLYNAAQAAARRRAASDGGRVPPAQAMVRCARCGTYVPRTEALPDGDGYRCASGPCVPRR